jgi:hypothetical protein
MGGGFAAQPAQCSPHTLGPPGPSQACEPGAGPAATPPPPGTAVPSHQPCRCRRLTPPARGCAARWRVKGLGGPGGVEGTRSRCNIRQDITMTFTSSQCDDVNAIRYNNSHDVIHDVIHIMKTLTACSLSTPMRQVLCVPRAWCVSAEGVLGAATTAGGAEGRRAEGLREGGHEARPVSSPRFKR